MSLTVRDLLTIPLSPTVTSEDLQMFTQALLSALNIPDTSAELLQLVINDPSTQVQKSAALYLSKSLNQTWALHFAGKPNGEALKSQIVQFFGSKPLKIIYKHVVYAIDPIFASDGDNWGQLHELMRNLYQSQDEQAFDMGLYIATRLIPKLSTQAFGQLFQFLLDYASKAISSPSSENVLSGCGLISVMICSSEGGQLDALREPFNFCLNSFISSLSTTPKYAIDMAQRFDFAFNSENLPIEADEILLNLISHFSEIRSVEMIYILFIPVLELLENHGKSVKKSLQPLISTSMSAISATFIDGSLEDQEDPMFISASIEMAAEKVRTKRFFKELSESFRDDSPGNLAASAIALYRCIPTLSETILKNIPDVLHFITSYLQYPSISIQQLIIMVMGELGSILQEGQSEVANMMIEPLIAALNSEELVTKSCSSLSKIMGKSEISVQFIEPLITKLFDIIEAKIDVNSAFDVLTSLVLSAGENVAPYSGKLLPILCEAASVQETIDPVLKANSIEALGYLLRFSEANLAEVETPVLELVIRSSDTEDFDIKSAVVLAIANITISSADMLKPYADHIRAIIEKYLSNYAECPPEFCSEEEEVSGHSQSQISFYTNFLTLIKTIVKRGPEILPADPSQWYNSCFSMLSDESEDLQVGATNVLTYFNLRGIGDPSELTQKLLSQTEAGGMIFVGSTFKAYHLFIENKIPIQPAQFESILQNVINGLTKRLKCQEESSEDPSFLNDDELEFSSKLYQLLASMATYSPEQFPVTYFLDHGKFVLSKCGQFEKSAYLGVLRQVYEFAGKDMRVLSKKTLLKYFLDGLEICDFSVIPEPLIAIRQIAEREFDSIAGSIDDILDVIRGILAAEYAGEMHFWTTVTSAVSFLCSIMKICPESFGFDEFIPEILAKLPVKGDEMEAENIYSSLLWAMENQAETMKAFEEPILVAFGLTLALEDKQFALYHLSEATAKGITATAASLAKKIGLEALTKHFQGDRQLQIFAQRAGIN